MPFRFEAKFDKTVGEFLKLKEPKNSEHQLSVTEALKKADSIRVIENLRHGLDTVIDADGLNYCELREDSVQFVNNECMWVCEDCESRNDDSDRVSLA